MPPSRQYQGLFVNVPPQNYAAQRSALPAWGGSVNSPSKRDSPQARKVLKKRGAYPKSGARFVSPPPAHFERIAI